MASLKNKEVKLSSFSSHKKLLTLTKPRSPNSVLVCTEDLPDEWFIDVVEYRTKSEVVTNVSTIIKKDLLVKLDWYYRNGWIALTNN